MTDRDSDPRVEVGAQALFDHHYRNIIYVPWEEAGERVQNVYRSRVRVVLDAIDGLTNEERE